MADEAKANGNWLSSLWGFVNNAGQAATSAYNNYRQGELANARTENLEADTEAKRKQKEQLTQIAVIGGVVLLLGVGLMLVLGGRRRG